MTFQCEPPENRNLPLSEPKPKELVIGQPKGRNKPHNPQELPLVHMEDHGSKCSYVHKGLVQVAKASPFFHTPTAINDE